eukprot:12048-Amorphochlora_amoeboformis.AAC.1
MMMTVAMKKMIMKATISDSRLTTTTNNTLRKPLPESPPLLGTEFVVSDKFADNISQNDYFGTET